MKKAVTARCTLVGGLLLTLVFNAAWGVDTGSASAGAIATSKVAPAAPSVSTITPEKQNKLREAMEQGERAYREGQFKDAVQWYTSAKQLEPGNAEVEKRLASALRLRDIRQKELSALPADPKQREQFLDRIFQDANNYLENKQYEQAYKAFNKLWLVAGNYKGQTVQLAEKAGEMMDKQGGRVVSIPVQASAPTTQAPASLAVSVPAPPAPAPVQVQAPVAPEPAPAPAATVQVALSSPVPAKAESVAAQIPPIEPVAYEQPAGNAPVPDDKGLAKGPAAAPVQLASAGDPAPASTDGDLVDDLTRLQVTSLLHAASEARSAGKIEEARKSVAKALELWPNNTEAKALMADLDGQAGYSPRQLVDTYLSEGDALAAEGKFAEATLRYDEALKADPNNQDAAARKAKVLRIKVKSDNLAEVKLDAAQRRELNQLHDQALKAYDAKDVLKAREIWQRILTQDPSDKRAETYLEQTKAQVERLNADQKTREKAEQLSEQAQKLLDSPISVSTDRRVPLDEFMKILSFSTPMEMEYNITEGAKTQISGNFQNKSLREVLDTVLKPVGLTWSINDKNVILIDQELITRTYTLSQGQMSKVRALSASGELQKNVWGQAEPPAQGCSITLDERQNMMVVTGSKLHIDRIESLLPALKSAEAQEMQVRIYKINEKDGPRIKSLINSIISATSDTPFDLERKIYVDKDDLIVRDTPENIRKIEELLLDKKFIQDMRNDKLDIQNYSLVPRDTEVVSDQIRSFTARVVEAIKVFLYSQEGESKAMEEGRRLWYDPYTLQLTIVDTPTNLARVGQYIEALPELGQKTRQEVVFLTYAVAEDLAGSLERIMEITSGGGAGGEGGGEEVVFKLRQGEEKPWRNLRIRLLRVQDPGRAARGGGNRIRNQGTAELIIDNGFQSENRNLQELTTEYVDDYRITLEDVNAQAGSTGAGSCRIRISYVPQMVRNQMSALQNQMMPDQTMQGQAPTVEDTGISINPFGELNALILRYTNPALYKDVMDLITQLDKPMHQVSIETKFVEVNETRAKEFSADFDLTGLGQAATGQNRNLDWNTSRFNSRFAQDSDEFRDIFTPPIENPLAAGLGKGTTVFNAVIGNTDPLLNFTLRFLEAEAVLNIVNGPRVTSLDGQEATFRIEMYSPTNGGSTTRPGTGNLSFGNPFQNSSQDLQLADVDEVDNQNIVSAVVLRVTPEITSTDSIILNELSAELIDYDNWVGETAMLTTSQQTNNQTVATASSVAPPQATVNPSQLMMLKRKRIETNARINNGGTIILGGWTGERSEEITSGVPVLRNMPYIGKLLFSRAQRSSNKTTLLIFLTCSLVE